MKFSLLLAICGLATCAPAVAQEKGADFRYRGWIGAPLPNDADKGCAMAAQARGGVFVAYANATGAFKIGVGGDDFELEPGKETIAAVVFDDGPPIVLKGVAASKAMALFEPIDFPAGGGLEPLVESSRSVRLTFAGRYLRARLNGSSRALRMLRDCATAPQPVAPMAAANGNAASGPRRASAPPTSDFCDRAWTRRRPTPACLMLAGRSRKRPERPRPAQAHRTRRSRRCGLGGLRRNPAKARRPPASLLMQTLTGTRCG